MKFSKNDKMDIQTLLDNGLITSEDDLIGNNKKASFFGMKLFFVPRHERTLTSADRKLAVRCSVFVIYIF